MVTVSRAPSNCSLFLHGVQVPLKATKWVYSNNWVAERALTILAPTATTAPPSAAAPSGYLPTATRNTRASSSAPPANINRPQDTEGDWAVHQGSAFGSPTHKSVVHRTVCIAGVKNPSAIFPPGWRPLEVLNGWCVRVFWTIAIVTRGGGGFGRRRTLCTDWGALLQVNGWTENWHCRRNISAQRIWLYDYMTSIFLPLRPKKERKRKKEEKKRAARPVICSSVVIIVYDWVAASGRTGGLTVRSFAVENNSNFATSKTIYCLARDVIVLCCWQTRGLEMSRVIHVRSTSGAAR